jgi:FkbM family methyltransferase
MHSLVRSFKKVIVARPLALFVVAAVYALAHGCSLGRRKDRYVVSKGRREIHLALGHAVYIFDMVRQFEDCFVDVAPESIGGVEVVDFSTPKLHRIPWLGVDIFYNSLAEEKADVDAYMRRLAPGPGEVVLDLGAYCGATAYAFSRAVGEQGRVVAIEADPKNYSALAGNVERLGIGNVESIQAAVWSSSGSLSFAAEGSLGSAVVAVGPRETNAIEVDALTLDDICARAGLSQVNHVKMDIEGGEYEVLWSSRDFFARHRPDIMLELHNNSAGIVDYDGVGNYFLDLNYSMERDIGTLVYCRPI